jgi:hypothetical protein
MWWNAARSERQLEARLANTLAIAETSLAEPLWNFDHDTVASVLEALLLEESIVYADVVESRPGADGRTVERRHAPEAAELDFEALSEDYNGLGFSDRCLRLIRR